MYKNNKWKLYIVADNNIICKLSSKNNDKRIQSLQNIKGVDTDIRLDYVRIKNIDSKVKFVSGPRDLIGVWVGNKIKINNNQGIDDFILLLIKLDQHLKMFSHL